MSDHVPDEVDPAGRDLRAYTDELRPHHRVVRNRRGEWVLLRHADVVAAALDPETFSNATSAHLHLPNGLDGAEHRAVRQALDRYFTADALAPHEPVFRSIARELLADVPRGAVVDAVRDIGAQFAVRTQSAWLGWPSELETRLLDWMADNHAATRSGDRTRTAAVAADFDELITSILAPRRELGDRAPDDVTTALMRDGVDGRRFTDDELVSILRNWTGGDLGSIALCLGVVLAYLAENPSVQDRLRAGVPEEDLDAIVDEVLRIDDPFVSNKRRATCPARIGGADIPEGATVKLNWTSANRDTEAFGDPDAFDPTANASDNLVYGIGPHVCPGRPLATMELRVAVQELLAGTTSITFAPGEEPDREVAPVGGHHRVPVVLT